MSPQAFHASLHTYPVCLLSLIVPSFDRSRSGICNCQEPHSAGEIAGAGGAPAVPESRDQAGGGTDRRTASENTGGRRREGWAGAGGLPAWGLRAWAAARARRSAGVGAAFSARRRGGRPCPGPAHRARGLCELCVPDPYPGLRLVLDLVLSRGTVPCLTLPSTAASHLPTFLPPTQGSLARDRGPFFVMPTSSVAVLTCFQSYSPFK